MSLEATGTPLSRVSFRFDEHGRHAAGLATGPDDALHVETWSFDEQGAGQARLLPTAPTETHATQPVPAGDGSVVVLRGAGLPRELVLIEPAGQGASEYLVARLGHPSARLLPSPDPATLALVITTDAAARTTIWRLTAPGRRLEAALHWPGPLRGGLWLEDTGRHLAVTTFCQGRPTAAAADLRHATVTPLWPDGELPLLIGRRSRLALVAAHTADGHRLGIADTGTTRPTRYPTALNSLTGSVTPLAADPSGERFALALTRGARSHLAVFDTTDDTLTEPELPDGVITSLGSWTPTGLRFLFTAPRIPATVATVAQDGTCLPSNPTPARASRRRTWAQAHLETLDGPAGPIEAVVYGGAAWRHSPRLLIALHGGPAAAWTLRFSPLFQRLAQAGIAVLAPNQRGSTGYGRAHHEALHHAWGVPDLADIRHLATALNTERRRTGLEAPALYGTSYGAFLALLAAGCEPALFSACAVTAPFVSAPRLYEHASPPVQTMLDRLGALTQARDGLGPRDLVRFIGRIRVPLLIAHGTHDEVIPVAHARTLRAHLRSAGRREGEDFSYLEVPGGRHDLLGQAGSGHLATALTRFLAGAHPTNSAATRLRFPTGTCRDDT
ncbi:alpha/beta fold hydrolase [Streptomyces sp. NPDC001250]|uniref:alpha/beta hydrolase family protein n=1 Tax=unclassified Streptomyces TaxID=2593676 RepID=UPI00331DE179